MGMISCEGELRDELRRRLDNDGFKDSFDFLTVPVRDQSWRLQNPGVHINIGYAWVNFISPEWAQRAKIFFEESGQTVSQCRFQGWRALMARQVKAQHPSDGWPLTMCCRLGKLV